MKKSNILILSTILVVSVISACGGGETTTEPAAETVETPKPKAEANPLGIGPIKEQMTFGEINPELASEGEAIFTQMCTACHKMDKRHVGPALAGVMSRRNPAWVMNMILNPDEMVKEDPAAKELLAEYLSPMANQNLTQEQARAVVEYFRKFDQENPQ